MVPGMELPSLVLLTLVVATLTFLATYFLSIISTSGPRTAPYPVLPLPFLGHALRLDTDPRAQFRKWRKQCGDVFRLNVGKSQTIVLNGYKAIKEAMFKQADVLGGGNTDEACVANTRVKFTSASTWMGQSSVCGSLLRAFGTGRNILGERIEQVTLGFVKQLQALKATPADLGRLTKVNVAKVLGQVLVGQEIEADDPQLLKLFTLINDAAAKTECDSVLSYLPFLRYIPGDPFGADAAAKTAKEVQDIFATFVQQGSEQRIDNILAAYRHEMKRKQESGSLTSMSEDKLTKTLLDMFSYGLDNVTSTISWCILCILHSPHVQEKIFKEIQAEVGSERTPSLHDKNSLPYLSAVIMEAQRLGNIQPLNAPLKCNTDTEVLGFKIPKDASVIFNLDSVLHDPEVMGADVTSFRPERFIDNTGKLVEREELIPYSLGQRSCPSESFANMNLFLFMSSLFQKFQFIAADAKNLPSLKGNQELHTIPPFHYDVRVISRV